MPECRGRRKTSNSYSIECPECDGRGYTPIIEQKFSAELDCSQCGGDGCVERPTGEREPCDEAGCFGTGYVGSEVYSLTAWQAKGNRLDPARAIDKNHGEGHKTKYRLLSGKLVELRNCPMCEDTPSDECPGCDGLRRVVQVHQECPACHGAGTVDTVEEVPCAHCDGDGVIDVVEDRDVWRLHGCRS